MLGHTEKNHFLAICCCDGLLQKRINERIELLFDILEEEGFPVLNSKLQPLKVIVTERLDDQSVRIFVALDPADCLVAHKNDQYHAL